MSVVLSERYAQRRAGGRMHLVSEFGQHSVANVARCGATPVAGRGWRMTSNVPWANACRNCRRCRARFVAAEDPR